MGDNIVEMLRHVVAQHAEEYDTIALRVDDRNYQVGEIMLPSRVWEDGSPTDQTLPGTSGIRVKAGGELADPAEALSLLLRDYGRVCGRYLYLIGGHYYEWGEDELEVIVKDAEVLAKYDTPAHPPR